VSSNYGLQASVTPAGVTPPATARVAALIAQASNGDGQCNTDAPFSSTLDRFEYIVSFLASNGFYVVSSCIHRIECSQLF